MTRNRQKPFDGRKAAVGGPSAGDACEAGRDAKLRFVIDGQLPELREAYAEEIAALKRRGAQRKARRKAAVVAAVALAIVVGAAEISFGWRSVAADLGRPVTVGFQDGSRIFLDAGGQMDVPVAPWRREARLVEGDAVFEIVHDPRAPFAVQTPVSSLTDLGTRFLVRAQGGSADLAVFEGRVEMTSSTGHRMTVGAGQAARAGPAGLEASQMPDEDEAAAWSRGRLVFRDTPLDQVADRLSRYSQGPVLLNAPGLAGLKVSGTFHIDDTDGALRVLEAALPVRIIRRDGTAFIVPRGR